MVFHLFKRSNRRDGFTLAELLIVVAIIAILVAIAIPIFTSQLEKSRESTDAANIRAQYAEVAAAANTEGTDINASGAATVTLRQKADGWQSDTIGPSLDSIADQIVGEPKANVTARVSYESGKIIIHYSGGSGGGSGTGDDTPSDNQTTGNAIGNQILQYMTDKHYSNGSHVTITVNSNGTFSVSISGNQHGASADDIRNELLKQYPDGKIPASGNGYKIEINKNNGHNGGNVTVTNL